MIFHKGQRYLKLTTDGYIYPYTEALAKQKKMVEFFPFDADPPPEIAGRDEKEIVIREKLSTMTKREINDFAGLGKGIRVLQLTQRPVIIEEAVAKLMWR